MGRLPNWLGSRPEVHKAYKGRRRLGGDVDYLFSYFMGFYNSILAWGNYSGGCHSFRISGGRRKSGKIYEVDGRQLGYPDSVVCSFAYWASYDRRTINGGGDDFTMGKIKVAVAGKFDPLH
jgi:hypothetical protein